MLTTFISNMKNMQYSELIFNNISDMIFLVSADEDGSFRYITANQNAIDTLHFPGDFRGKKIFDLMPSQSAEIITQKYQEALQNKETITYQSQMELPTSNRDLHKRYSSLESKVTPIFNSKGECEHIISVTRDVTAWIEHENQLKQVKEQMDLMFNNAADAVFMFDHHANYTSVNPGFSKLLGWKEEELTHNSSISILPNTENDFPEILAQLRNGNVIQNHHSKRVTKKGKTIDVLASYSPIMEGNELVGGVAMYKDITEIKRMEDRLRESEERYRLIANHTNDLIRVIDLDGIIQYASPSHEPLLGLPSDFYIGKSVASFVHKDDIDKVQRFWKQIAETGESFETEHRLFHKNGDIIWGNTKGTPVLGSDGNVEQIVVVIRDVSTRKHREDELRSMAMHDQLTGLPNRRLLYQQLHNEIENVKRTNKQFTVLTMDCDNFKHINDNYGHDIGDEIIKGFGQRIHGNLKETDMVSRMGGDEFQAIITNLDETNDVIPIAKRILKVMEQPFKVDHHTLSITTSIGISSYKEDKSLEQLFKESDEALYKAKTIGKNTFCMYAESPYSTPKKWSKIKRLFNKL
ncbi:PAS domain S-box protein [Halobacillus seohaensis]|uniref:PAS domain S-box protein n=1 Tax=Halobacillus seohaensis TaxID=447421 RepID=A0ABW2ERE4_9BACI